LAKDKERLDQMLAYLTYHRHRYIEAGKDRWDAPEMASDILAEFDVFLAKLNPEMGSWFGSRSHLAQERSFFGVHPSCGRLD
jgi:hypothetical protein